jgi:hypothetical protein
MKLSAHFGLVPRSRMSQVLPACVLSASLLWRVGLYVLRTCGGCGSDWWHRSIQSMTGRWMGVAQDRDHWWCWTTERCYQINLFKEIKADNYAMALSLHCRQTYLKNPRFQAPYSMLTRSALLWHITQRHVIIVYWRFGTRCRSHLQVSRSSRRKGLIGCLNPWRWDISVVPKRR